MRLYFAALILVFSFATYAQESKRQMSPLDQAYVTAMQTKQEAVFYNAFLNATIFIATANAPSQEKTTRAGEQDTISPIIVESEGAKYIMLFDSEERLLSWAKREVGFAAIPGHAIVEMMSPEFHWALNVGTEHVKTFVPDEISWLKQNLGQAKEERVPAGTQVLIGAPAKIPAGLVESLKKNLSSRNREVKAAYLGQVFYVRDGEKPHLALVLEVATKDKTAISGISKDLAIATKGYLGEDEYIDIMAGDENGTAVEIKKAVKPFYVKKWWK